jgi:hypothetical protein
MNERRVLIIGPDAALATAYGGALRDGGLAVDVLSDVGQAVEQTAARAPDLLVLDADPSVGDMVCRGVKKKNGKSPAVLLVSEKASGKRSLFGAHPDMVLQKPVSTEALLKSVAGLLKIRLREPTAPEIPLDESLLEIVEEARPKEPLYPRRPTLPPMPGPSARPTPPPVDLPPRPKTLMPQSKPAVEPKRDLEAMREVLKKKPAPAADAAQLPDRVQELEAERNKLRSTIEELRVRNETEGASRAREMMELKAALGESVARLAELERLVGAAPDLQNRLSKTEQERDKAWAELIELMPRAESASALAVELESLRAAIGQREEQLRERDRRLSERDAMVADKDRQIRELDARRAATETELDETRAEAQAAQEIHAAEAAKAAEQVASPVFARERELLDARRTINERDKQLIELRGEIEARERTILDAKHGTLEVEKRLATATDQILELEQKLLAANEKNAEHEREIARLNQLLTTEREERAQDAERARQTLAAAGAAHEQAVATLGRKHADEIAALNEAAAAERAELESRSAARIEAMRNQSKDQLAEAETRRQADLAQAEQTRQAVLAAAGEAHKKELAEQAARNSAERLELGIAHEKQLGDLIREYEQRSKEQQETFQDLKNGMKQRHASEVEELTGKHAARVAELEARIADVEGQLAQTMADLMTARDKIEGDLQRSRRAQRALSVALELLEAQQAPPASED